MSARPGALPGAATILRQGFGWQDQCPSDVASDVPTL